MYRSRLLPYAGVVFVWCLRLCYGNHTEEITEYYPNCSFIPQQRRPKLIVFDTDYTLWPFNFYYDVMPPVRNGTIRKTAVDKNNKTLKPYPDVPIIFKTLYKLKYKIGVATRGFMNRRYLSILRYTELMKYISYQQCYALSQRRNLHLIQRESGVDFNEMLYFDDEITGCIDASDLNLTAILVFDGMNMATLNKGFEVFEYSTRRKKRYLKEAINELLHIMEEKESLYLLNPTTTTRSPWWSSENNFMNSSLPRKPCIRTKIRWPCKRKVPLTSY